MKTMLLIMSLAVISSAGVLPASAQDHHYLPLEPGNELWYVNTGDPALTLNAYVEAGPAGTSIFNFERMVNGEVVGTSRGHFVGNDEGDIVWIGPEIGGELIPFSSTYVLIDAPLFLGKVWTFETSHPNWGAIEFTAEVVAEEWISVAGVGNLYCFKVHYDEVWENVGPRFADRWYADGFGQVQFDDVPELDPFLVTAAVVIPVEEQTWGSVKSMYR